VASHGRAASSLPNASLRADVADWSVVPSVGVPSGRTRIIVRNVGAQIHQLISATAPFRVR
jgi:hypothetical protein